MEQYDAISISYAQVKATAGFCMADTYTLREALRSRGDLTGQAALDVACGPGDTTRLLARCGAAPVIGVDVSSEMVRLARTEEKARPLGIEYQVVDAAELPVLGKFTLVNASYLFNYAPSRGILDAMFRGIRANVEPGGVLLATVPNPGSYVEPENGASGARLVERVEGGEVPILHMEFLSDAPVKFTNYEWPLADYVAAAIRGGFIDVTSYPARTPPPDEQRSAEFWLPYQSQPRSSLLTCFVDGR